MLFNRDCFLYIFSFYVYLLYCILRSSMFICLPSWWINISDISTMADFQEKNEPKTSWNSRNKETGVNESNAFVSEFVICVCVVKIRPQILTEWCYIAKISRLSHESDATKKDASIIIQSGKVTVNQLCLPGDANNARMSAFTCQDLWFPLSTLFQSLYVWLTIFC